MMFVYLRKTRSVIEQVGHGDHNILFNGFFINNRGGQGNIGCFFTEPVSGNDDGFF